MNIRIISVPYDSGHRDYRMGRGPGARLGWGLAGRIAERGHSVTQIDIEGPKTPPAEVATGFELCRLVATEVQAARAQDAFPLVLTGNCLMQVGVVAGLGSGTGLIWLDAHGDLNTPETTQSGFLDGMALAIVGGWCWKPLADGIVGFAAVPSEHMALVGARDLDPPEHACIADRGITHVVLSEIVEGDGIGKALQRMHSCETVSLHLDLDVFDPSVCVVNALQPVGGLRQQQVTDLLTAAFAQCHVGALTVSAYDPGVDGAATTPVVADAVLGSILA